MNWDNQMSSILSDADGSVAKMRERLSFPRKFSKCREDLNPVLPHLSPLPRRSPSPLHTGVQWADLAAIQSQLQIQSQVIESLTQKLHGMDREKHSQQGTIRTLQDEVRRLREQVNAREEHEERTELGPGGDRRMEQWKREVGRELNNLRGHITRGTSLGNLEESFSSKLRREELEGLRREVDQLKTQLRRQEEDVFVQQSEARETRRQYERSCKTLEELTDSYRTHSFDLAKNVSQYTHIEQDVRQLRTTVSELKEEVRNLILREREPTHVLPLRSTVSPPAAHRVLSSRRKVRVQEPESESESEVSSLTPSLAEISSDESWLEDKKPAPRKGVHASIQSKRTDFEDPGSDLEEEEEEEEENDEDDVNVNDEDDGNLGLESDLSLTDL